MKTVDQMWQNFADQVIPKDAPAAQYLEMRRAFFAGVHSLLNGLATLPAGTSDEDGTKAMEAAYDEVNAFFSPDKPEIKIVTPGNKLN